MVDIFRLAAFCLLSLSCRSPCAISTTNSLHSVLLINLCGPLQSCSIQNNSTTWIRFYFWSAVNSIDTTSFTLCHKVIGSQQYHELCTRNFTVEVLVGIEPTYRVEMNVRVNLPSALVGRWYTLMFNSTGSLWAFSSIAVHIITN
ncbi:hypothetical protein PHET_10609 [Paragonimus heterotremus]|uniref:Secreted protein n=1 Tax=Paragonimus heterotremus TaxID=100268 RepID=A0A8J4SRV5_9TREM|nr:hypothetical protein PHET_10609 [Paragonimus heterotremus]